MCVRIDVCTYTRKSSMYVSLVSVPARVKSSHYITVKRELYTHHAVWAFDSGDGDTVGGWWAGCGEGVDHLLRAAQTRGDRTASVRIGKMATKCGRMTCALDSEAGGDTIKRMLRSNEGPNAHAALAASSSLQLGPPAPTPCSCRLLPTDLPILELLFCLLPRCLRAKLPTLG